MANPRKKDIPTHTPEEAIAEMEYAVHELSLKTIVMPSHVQRPIRAFERDFSGSSDTAFWLDTYGIDSEHDYDPLWARCLELGIAPSFHSPGIGWGSRRSISSYVYNHIGHFASASEAVAKSLFLGGVTRRFPDLRFAFLEGGVGWALGLFVFKNPARLLTAANPEFFRGTIVEEDVKRMLSTDR